jgi:hypothetical protein
LAFTYNENNIIWVTVLSVFLTTQLYLAKILNTDNIMDIVLLKSSIGLNYFCIFLQKHIELLNFEGYKYCHCNRCLDFKLEYNYNLNKFIKQYYNNDNLPKKIKIIKFKDTKFTDGVYFTNQGIYIDKSNKIYSYFYNYKRYFGSHGAKFFEYNELAERRRFYFKLLKISPNIAEELSYKNFCRYYDNSTLYQVLNKEQFVKLYSNTGFNKKKMH